MTSLIRYMIAASAAMTLFAPQTFAQGVVYFEDNFDGPDLGIDWIVENPNPDTYLVEGGILIMLSPDKVPAQIGVAANVMKLDKPIPQGDWTMTVGFTITPQTMGESIAIGLGTDAENSLLANLRFQTYDYVTTGTELVTSKSSNGEITSFNRRLFDIGDRDVAARGAQFSNNIKGVELRLAKNGRKYTAALRFQAVDATAGVVSEEWATIQELTSLRTPGENFLLLFGSNSNDYTPYTGEGLVEVDFVRIEVVE